MRYEHRDIGHMEGKLVWLGLVTVVEHTMKIPHVYCAPAYDRPTSSYLVSLTCWLPAESV